MRLQSTLHIMDQERFQCGKCLKKYRGRADEKTILQKYRKNMGCFGNTRRDNYEFGGYIYRTCPGNVFHSDAVFIIELYREFQKGIMPYPGSLVEQPAKVMEAFSVIDGYNNRKIAEEQKKQKELQRRGRNRPGNRR